MKRLAICCLSFLTASFVSVSHAETLLQENCDSGTISPCISILDEATGVSPCRVFIDDILAYAGTPTTPPTGACNFPGSCQILTEADCLAQSGTYDGDDTVCATVFNIPGDCNQDGALDLSDVVCLLGHLFQGNPSSLPCSTEDATKTLLDCNGDGSIDLSDAIFKLTFLFQGGLPPEGGEGCIAIPDCPQNAGCL